MVAQQALVPDRLPIAERFVSVQGEGLLVGIRSSFVRVSGCNLRCGWCDSPATSWAPEHTYVTVDELLEFCAEGPHHVVITGGEPMMFPKVASLSERLKRSGHHVTIETAGTVWRDVQCDLMSISPKLAHSTPWERDASWAHRHERMRLQPEVIARLMEAHAWQLKPVVRAVDPAQLADDLDEVEALLERLAVPPSARSRVLLMPECIDRERLPDDYANLVDVCRSRGFTLGERRHIELFGHTPNT